MYEALINQVQEAIDRSMAWAEKGWKVTFGGRGVEVCSLQQAQNLPENFVYREEALDYWSHVAQTGEEAAAYGRKALYALIGNDLKAAADAIYSSQYLEKDFADLSMTWKPVHEAATKKTLKRKSNN